MQFSNKLPCLFGAIISLAMAACTGVQTSAPLSPPTQSQSSPSVATPMAVCAPGTLEAYRNVTTTRFDTDPVLVENDHLGYQQRLTHYRELGTSISQLIREPLCQNGASTLDLAHDSLVAQANQQTQTKIAELTPSARYALALHNLDEAVRIQFLPDTVYNVEEIQGVFDENHYASRGVVSSIGNITDALLLFEQELESIRSTYPTFAATAHGTRLNLYATKSLEVRLLFDQYEVPRDLNFSEFFEPLRSHERELQRQALEQIRREARERQERERQDFLRREREAERLRQEEAQRERERQAAERQRLERERIRLQNERQERERQRIEEERREREALERVIAESEREYRAERQRELELQRQRIEQAQQVAARQRVERERRDREEIERLEAERLRLEVERLERERLEEERRRRIWDWHVERRSDYTARSGAVVEVRLQSDALKRAVKSSVERITAVTGIGIDQRPIIGSTQKRAIFNAWISHVVTDFESTEVHSQYGNRRNQIIQSGGGRAGLEEILTARAAVCRELTIMAHIVFAEFGIPTQVVNGTLGGGGHAWIETPDGLVVDSNYTRNVDTFDHYRGVVNFINRVDSVELVRPL